MRRVRYGVGMSVDGCIADAKGGTGFLVREAAYDPAPFFTAIDTVLMGRRTYLEAVRRGMRAYPGLRNYVASRTLVPHEYPEVTVIGDALPAAVAAWRMQSGKDIWLCGGGELARSLFNAGLVDTIEVGVSPVLLGQPGTPLLAPGPASEGHRLELTGHAVYPSGLLVLEYAVRAADATA